MKNLIELTQKNIKEFLPERSEDSDKGTFGKVLNIAGSRNYKGAAYLSSVSALKSGAGLVCLASIKEVLVNLFMPPVTTFTLEDYKQRCISKGALGQLMRVVDKYEVVSIGCGISEDRETLKFFKRFLNYLTSTDKTVVIDADGLNIIASSGITKLPENTILTPHPGELARLMRVDIEQIQANRLEYTKRASEKYECHVLLKGFESLIYTKDCSVFKNKTGCSALAKAGSGDVLTGMIAGLCAQNENIEQSLPAAVFLHGLAGDIAALELTEYCVNADNLIDYIPKAFAKVLK